MLVMLIIVHCQYFPRKVSSIMTDLFLDKWGGTFVITRPE